MKTRKKLLSLLLSAAMIVSLLPSVAFAAAGALPNPDYTVSYNSEETATNGGYSIEPTEGATLSYSDPTLTITTTGAGKIVLLDASVPTDSPTIKIAVGEVRFAKSGQQIKLYADGKEHVYAAQADNSALSMGAPHTVTAGSIAVTPAAGTPNSDSWTAAEGAILTLGETSVTGGPGGATLANSVIPTAGGTIASLTGHVNNGSSFTMGGGAYTVTAGETTFEDGSLKTGAATVTGDVENLTVLDGTLTVTGNVTGTLTMGGTAAITVTGDVGKVSAGADSSGTLTISGSVTSTASNAVYFSNSDATVTVTDTVAGGIYTGGAGNHTATLTIGEATFKAHEASSFHASATFDGDTLTVSGGKITAVPGDANIPYNVVMNGKIVDGHSDYATTFDAAGKAIAGDVTFASASTNSKVLSTGYTADPRFIGGRLTWEDGAQGALGTKLSSGGSNYISIGANAKAWFMGGFRLSAAYLDDTKGIGAGATVGVLTTNGYLYQDVIAGMGQPGSGIGDDLTFYMSGDTKLGTVSSNNDGPITTAEGSTLTIRGYASPAADVTKAYAQAITVSKGSTLNLGGSDAGDGVNEKSLALTGDLTVAVAENATLNLTNVKLNGDQKDRITVADGGKVNYIGSDGEETGSGAGGSDIEVGGGGAGTEAGKGTGDALVDDVTAAGFTVVKVKPVEPEVPAPKEAAATEAVWTISDGGKLAGVLTSKNDGTALLELDPGYTMTLAMAGEDAVYGTAPAAAAHAFAMTVAEPETPALKTVGERYLFSAVGGKTMDLTLGLYAKPATHKEGTVTYADETALTVHNDAFSVGRGASLTVELNKFSALGKNASFDLAEGATVTLKGTTAGTPSQILSYLKIEQNNVTILLDNVAVNRNATGTDDVPTLWVAAGVTGTKLIVRNDCLIRGRNGADAIDNVLGGTSATALGHNQSAGIYNAGELAIEAEKDATLTVTGGVAIGNPDSDTFYRGGAGVYNAANAKLTFSGAGVINVTGGVGGVGFHPTGNGTTTGGAGGVGGPGLYNAGTVTVAMTSAKWAQGQLAISGGVGGTGGQGQKAIQGAHSWHNPGGSEPSWCNGSTTSGGKGGTGGASGGGVKSTGAITVDSGVFLTYSGAGGAGGAGGDANTITGCGNPHSVAGATGDPGADNGIAIDGTDMTITGGTIYAQSGDKATGGYGINLSGAATIGGGSVWAGTKADTGFDDALASALSTDVAGTFCAVAEDGFHAAKKMSGTEFTSNDAAYTRVKFAGLEGGVYRVVGDIVLSVNGPKEYTYGADSLYVNPQGFAYLYLPNNSTDGTGSWTTAIDRVVLEDAAGARYLLRGEKPVNVASGTRTKNNNYIQLTGTWCEEFQVDGKTYATGVNMSYNPNGTYLIKTPSDLATLAYRVSKGLNTAGKFYTVYTGVTEVDMSAFLWNLPIGTEGNPFRGIFGGSDRHQKTIKGLRMPAGYTGEAYGLFGYADGADIYSIKVSNAATEGNPYVKTLAGSYLTSGMTDTASGGRYAYTAADLQWHSKTAAYMGGVVGRAVNGTKITGCAVDKMDMASESTADNVYVGGVAGYLKDSSIGACSVGSGTSDAEMKLTTVDPGKAAYVGGLAGYAENSAIGGGSVGGSQITADIQTAAGAKAYAGGAAGYAKNTTITGVDLGQGSSGQVTIKALPGPGATAGQVMYAGGVAGYAENAVIENFATSHLDRLTIEANTGAIETGDSGHKAYAGGVTGASVGTAYDNIAFQTGVASAIAARVYGDTGNANTTVAGHYAGGLTASSGNDTVKNVSIIGGADGSAVTVTAANGKAGGFAALADGSKFYRSFVRGVTVAAPDGSFVSLIQTAANTEMVGCYAQGVTGAPARAFATITGGKYVGCYSTTGAWNAEGTGGAFYNCYYQSTENTTTAADDAAVAVNASTLKAGAVGTMTAELMKTETDGKSNTSGFDWEKDFGTPIGYTADTTAPANGGYPIYGEPRLVEILVVEGAEYGAAKLTPNDATIFQVAAPKDGYASYYVMDGTDSSVIITLAEGVNKLAKYAHKIGAADSFTEVEGNVISTATLHAGKITADTRIELKLTPETYHQFTVTLNDGTGVSGSVSNSSGSGSATLSGSTVAYKTSTNNVIWSDVTNGDAAAIKTLILTASGGAKITMPDMTGWTKADTGDSNYLHYTTETAKTAEEVQNLLKKVNVTFQNSARGTENAKTLEINASVSDKALPVSQTFNPATGHFYAASAGSRTWQSAAAAAKLGSNAGFRGYLAIVNDGAENNFLANLPAVKTTAWINANDNAAEGTWLYTEPDGATGAQPYFNWQQGEPNNAGTKENYAAMYATGFWNDYPAATALGMTFVEYGGYATTMVHTGSNVYKFTVTNTSTGGGNNGDSGSITKPTKPEITGVSKLLNSVDHMAYMVGYDTGDFGPGDAMTRAEAAQMFFNLLKSKNVSGSKTFSDVDGGAWYARAVKAMANLGITDGVGGGEFAPGRTITRAEFVVMTLRFADKLTPGTKTFSDVPESHWAYDSIMAATGYGWINGRGDGTFDPTGTITRAEAVTIVNHMLARAADKKFIDKADGLTTFPDVPESHWAFLDVVEAANAHDYGRDKSGVESWKK